MTAKRPDRKAVDRHARSDRRASFSLVELVVVVVIIGLIAAIAVPRFSRATRSATETYINSTINTVQGAIGLYFAEHGKYPGYHPVSGAPNGTFFVKQLLDYSNEAGATQAVYGSPFIYGPYLRSPFPENPINKLNTVQVIATPGDSFSSGSTGWVAVLSNGDFCLNATEDDMVDYDGIDDGAIGGQKFDHM